MEIADDLLDDFYTKGITFGLNASDLSEVIQRTMDIYRQKHTTIRTILFQLNGLESSMI